MEIAQQLLAAQESVSDVIMTEESEELAQIASLWTEESLSLSQRTRHIEFYGEEEALRSTIHHDALCNLTHLLRRWDYLQRQGISPPLTPQPSSLNDVLAEIPPLRLPTILEFAEMPLETSSTYQSVMEELKELEEADEGLRTQLMARKRKLLVEEVHAREELTSDEQTKRQCQLRNFFAFVKQFQEMEEELNREAPFIVGAYLSERDQILYFTRGCVRSESLKRVLIMIDEDEHWARLNLAGEEQGAHLELIGRFVAVRAELKDSREQSLVQRLLSNSILVLGKAFWKPWREYARSRVKMYRAVVAIDYLQRQALERLLRLGCERLNHVPQTRRFERQQRVFFDAVVESYVKVVVSEEEERERMTITMDWLWRTDEIAELFFSDRDNLRWAMLARQVAVLGVASEEGLLRMRLVLWYRFARRRGLQRRMSWISDRTAKSLLMRYLESWSLLPEHRQQLRENCATLSTSEHNERRTLLLEEQESTQRLSIQHHWERRLCRWGVKCRVPLYFTSRVETVLARESHCLRSLLGAYLQRWIEFPKSSRDSHLVRQLWSKISASLLRDRYRVLLNFSQLSCLKKVESRDRSTLAREERQCFRRIRHPFALQELKERTLRRLINRRDDLCFKWLWRILRRRNKAARGNEAEERGMLVAKKLLLRYYRLWRRAAWNTKKDTLVEYLLQQSTASLLRRYFKRLDPLHQQLVAVSRLRQQLEAARQIAAQSSPAVLPPISNKDSPSDSIETRSDKSPSRANRRQPFAGLRLKLAAKDSAK